METIPQEEQVDVEALLQAFETSHGKYDYADTAPLHKASVALLNTGDPRQETIRADARIFDLTTRFASEDRFTSMWEGETPDGQKVYYPDLEKDFPPEALDYYAHRIDDTQNDFHRAIYCDYLWSRKDWKSRDRMKVLTLGVESYLKTSDAYLQEGNEIMAMDGMLRAVGLAVSANREPLIAKSIQHLVAFLLDLDTQKQYRWTLDILRFLANHYKKLTKHLDAAQMKQVLGNALVHVRANEPERWDTERMFQAVGAELYSAIREPEQAQACRVRSAETYLEEADWKRVNYPNGNLAASGLYEKALDVFIGLGMPAERIEEIKRKVQETNEATIPEMRLISANVEIAPEHRQQMQEHIRQYTGKELRQALQQLAIDVNLRPSLAHANALAARIYEDFPLQRLIPIRFMRGNITVKEVQGDDAYMEYRKVEAIVGQMQFAMHFMLTPIMDTLVTEHPDLDAGVESVMRESGFFDETRIALVKNGVGAYLRQDYIAAVHVLVPQVEGAFRDLLGALGTPTFTVVRGGDMRQRMLDDVLVALSQVPGSDPNFFVMVRYMLADILGLNLRNEVAHGLAGKDMFTKSNSELLILMLVHISHLRVVQHQATPDA